MSLLVAFVDSQPSNEQAVLAQPALAAAQRQGFTHPVRLNWQGGHALWFATPGNPRGSGACVTQGQAFAAYTGTLHWKGLTGEPLLRRLLADCRRPQDMPLRDFSGGFAMLFSQGAEAWLFNDAVGLQKIYQAPASALYSTSLLVCRATLKRPRLNRLRAQEYVLLGSNHGVDTPLQGLQVAEPTQLLDLCSGRSSTLHPATAWRSGHRFKDAAEALDTLSTAIAADFGSLLQALGPQVGMALSGGFDSRLLLAALHHHGVTPQLYVYGAADFDDVRIAQAKAAELGMPITCTDKRQADAGLPAINRELLRANISFFDGLPVDGIFERGSDRRTRLQQVAGGMLNLNGGGGEILRNFFYLPDRPYSARDLVGAFYSNWLPRAVPQGDERRALHAATADGILTGLGLDSGSARSRSAPLRRSDVELVYTLFRLRWWMARNNSVAARYGAFMTPLVQPRLVELAAQVPVGWKTFGELEARIITRLSPAVARGPSNYGFDFSAGPGPAHKRYINATVLRPIAMRRASARLRRLLGRNPSVAAPAEWQQALPLPATDWLDTRYLTSPAQWNRLMSLCAVLDDELCGVTA